MPAVLMELGFMDSKADAPIILTEEYADQCAGAIVSVMVKRGKLQKNTAASAVSVELQCVKPGDRSAEVYALQALLNRFSGKQIGVDGNFGAMTEAALRVFQAEHALKVTGIADSETWNEILKNPSKRKAVS